MGNFNKDEIANIVKDLKTELSFTNVKRLIEFYYPLVFDIIERNSANGTDYSNNIDNVFFGSLLEFCDNCKVDPMAFKIAYSNQLFERYGRWVLIDEEDENTEYDVTNVNESILLLGYIYTFERVLLRIDSNYDTLTLVKQLSSVKVPNVTIEYSNNIIANIKSINKMLGVHNDIDDEDTVNNDNNVKGIERCKLISGTIDDITATLRKIVEHYSINEPLGVFGYKDNKPVLYTYNNGLATVTSVSKVDLLKVNQFINNIGYVVKSVKLEPVSFDDMLNHKSDWAYSYLFAVSLLYHKDIRYNTASDCWELHSIGYDKYLANFNKMIRRIFENVLGVMDSLFNGNNEPNDVNQLSAFIDSLCNRLSNFFAVEQYNGYSLRLSARVGLFDSNREHYSIINDTIVTYQKGSHKLLDSGELNIVNSGFNGVIYSTMLITNRDKFYGETFFAYKMYEKRVKLKKYPSMSSLILGQANNGTDCTVNIARPEACVMNISAGTRQGKGVLTLNLLSCILATGGTICYCDAKPDMASTLWDIERTLRAESGIQNESGDILAMECVSESTGAVRNVTLGSNLPSVIQAHSDVKQLKQYIGVLSQFKVFQLLTVLGTEAIQPSSDSACHKLDISGSRSEPLIVVVDEMRNMSEALRSFMGAISSMTGKPLKDNGGSVALTISSREEGEHKELLESLNVYVKFVNSVRTDFASALNASITKTNFIKLICLGQRFSLTKTVGATVAVSIYKDLLSLSQVRIYGGGGAVGGAFGYCPENDGCKEIADVADSDKNSKIANTDDKVSTRKFVLYDSKEGMTKSSRVTAFKPYFVLNENNLPDVLTENEIDTICSDITMVNGCTGQFLTNIKESNREYVLKEELTNKGSDDLYHRNDAVGFLGLIKMLLNDESASDILHRFNRGYNILWSLVKQSGIASSGGYKNLEEYLYDCSTESFYTTDEIINAIKKGIQIGGNNADDNKVDTENIFDTDSEADDSDNDTDNFDAYENEDNTDDFDDYDEYESYEDGSDNEGNNEEERQNFEVNGGNSSDSDNDYDNEDNSDNDFDNDNESPYNSYGDGYDIYDGTFVCGDSNNIFAKTYNERSVMTDLLSLREASNILLKNIENVVGDLSRVRTIEFDENGVMIINNIIFKPKITNEYASTLPFDIRNAVLRGQWSELFNFKDIYKFKNLGALRIDNWDLAEIKLRNELGYVKHDWFKIKQKLKRKLPLQQLVIMGVLINEQDNVSREKINNVSRRNSFVNSCKNAFKAVGGKAASFVHSSHAQNIWVSKPVKFVRKALGWTLGTQAILWSVSAFGFVGLLGGAIAVASTLRNKDK